MKLPVYNQKGEKTGEHELNPAIFEVPANADLIHQVVVAQMANSRSPIAHTKQRSEVRGGGRKPWRQKGTGRARHGSIRSPLWRGGGVTFGPTKLRNFFKKVNKKMKRKALFMALTSKTEHDTVLLDALELPEAKTKQFVEIMNELRGKVVELSPAVTHAGKDSEQPAPKSKDAKTLIITPTTDEKLIVSSRNVPRVKITRADSLNVKDVIDFQKIIILKDSLAVIERTYLN